MGDRCDQVLEELQRYLDRECPADLQDVIAQHLADCPPCERRADFEEKLKAIVRASCRQEAPPDLLQRVRAQLHAGID